MIISAIRSLGFFLDSMVYWVVSVLYQIFMMISKTEIVNNDIVKSFFGRIYILVGIFMLFKISFSLITMIANPEKLTDKSSGLAKISTRVFVSIVMLLVMPQIFSTMYSLQAEIVKSNILGKVIIGTNADSVNSNEIGNMLAYTTFSAFFYKNGLDKVQDENELSIPSDVEKVYEDAGKNNDMASLGEILNEKQNGEYIFEYKGFISTIAGIFVAYTLLSFCIDIGIRCVKLGFLQIIAPVPIVMYIDPKSSQDGAFNKWIRMLLMTYLDLFLRLIVIFFIVFILGEISIVTIPDGNFVLRSFARVFIIIGALMFAKQAPDLIKDVFGIKGDTNAWGDLNPLKKMAKSPFVSGAVGLGVGGIAGAFGNAAATKQAGGNRGMQIRSGIAGLFSGGARGAFAGMKDQNHNGFAAGLKAGGVGGQHILNNQGTTFMGRMAARTQNAMGIPTKAQGLQNRLNLLGQYAKGREAIKSIAEGDKTKRNSLAAAFGSYDNVSEFKDAYDRAVASGDVTAIQDTKKAWDDATNFVINEDLGKQNTAIGATFDSMSRLVKENEDVFSGLQYMEADGSMHDVDFSAVSDARDLGRAYGAVKNGEQIIQSSEEYQRATKTDKAVNANKKGNGS